MTTNPTSSDPLEAGAASPSTVDAPSTPDALASLAVTPYNVGQWCLSEDECIARGIDFAAYERGVNDAAKAFERNGSPISTGWDSQSCFRVGG